MNNELDESLQPRWPVDRLGLVFGPIAMIAWLCLPRPDVLSIEAFRLAGVLILTIAWWLTEPIPIPLTGLLAIALCVLLGAVPGAESQDTFKPAKVALAPFADPSLFFLLGGLFIGRAMTRHGLDRRLALSILSLNWAARSPASLLAAVGIAVAGISMWVSNTAATAMMYPVTLGIIAVLAASSQQGEERFSRSPFASGLLLMTAYASSVGGIATPIGTATNVLAIGILEEGAYLGRPIDFLRWTWVGLPMMLAIMVGMTCWLRVRSPAGDLDLPALRAHLRRQHAALGRWNRGEFNTLMVFVTVVSLWIAPGVLALLADEAATAWFSQHFPEEIVALLAPILLYLLPVNWRTREFSLHPDDLLKIDWGAILLFGSGLALGNLMFRTGLADAVGQAVFAALGSPGLWTITALAVVAAILLSEFTSNVAAASTLLPVILSICQKADVDIIPPLFAATFGASFGSALPVSTPPNAIVYGSRLLPVRRMIIAGVGVDLVCALVIWVVLRVAYALEWSPHL